MLQNAICLIKFSFVPRVRKCPKREFSYDEDPKHSHKGLLSRETQASYYVCQVCKGGLRVQVRGNVAFASDVGIGFGRKGRAQVLANKDKAQEGQEKDQHL